MRPWQALDDRLRDQAFDDLIRDTAAVCLGRGDVRATVADQLTAIPEKLSELRAQLDGLPERNIWNGTVLALRRQMSGAQLHFNHGDTSDSDDIVEPVKTEPIPPSRPAASTPANGAAAVGEQEAAAPREVPRQGLREAQAAKLARQAAARRESGTSGRRIAALALAEQRRATQTSPRPSTPAAQTSPRPSTPAAHTAPPPSTPANGAAAVGGLREAQAAKLARQAAARRESGNSGRRIAALALAEQRRATSPRPSTPAAQTAPRPSTPAAQTAPPPSTPANGAAAVGGLREAQAAKLARQAAARRESGNSGRRIAALALAEQRRATSPRPSTPAAQTAPRPSTPAAQTAPPPSTPANGAAAVGGLREAQAAKLARQAAARRESGNSGRRIAALALAEQRRATSPRPSTPAAQTAPPPSTPANGAAAVGGLREAQAAKLARQAAARRESGTSGRRIAALALAEQRRATQTSPRPSTPAAQTAPPPSTPANGAAAAPWQGLREAQAAKLARQAAARRESGTSGRHLAAKALAEQQRGRQAVIARQRQTEQAVDEGVQRTGAAVDQAAKGVVNAASNGAGQAADSECLLHHT